MSIPPGWARAAKSVTRAAQTLPSARSMHSTRPGALHGRAIAS
ncbi:MAG: hypothetical protein LC130_26935 [Bryobacterales bacterium]|nr:hypothetical protein [Bryobacterales bacterium]